MPALDNPRWEQFCQRIVSGDDQKTAYEMAFGNFHPSVVVSASQLIDKQQISDRIGELRRLGLGDKAILSLTEKRSFLASVVRSSVGSIDENSPLTQSYKKRIRTERSGDTEETIEYELPNKLKALELDARLAGELNNGGPVSIRLSMFTRDQPIEVEAEFIADCGTDVEPASTQGSQE